jgi:hypothetical protein
MARSRKKAQTKSAKQVRFLFSEGSPLSSEQQSKLASEIRIGKVRVAGGKKKLGKKKKRRS